MIQLQGITKTYSDGIRALDGIDLSLGEGMFGLLGPNGAGKTTLLSILVLVLEPSSGQRLYDGLSTQRASHRRTIRGRIGYLPQDFSPLREASGRQYLAHCARLRGVRPGRRALARRIEALLDAVGLVAVADRPCGGYSGGMRRRLGVAQALIHSPSLLVVDEPTAGLDPEERIRFRNLVTEVAEHTAVLLSTHIVEDIEATCPRIAIIARGRKVFDGEPGTLLRRVDGHLWQLPEEATPPPNTRPIARRVSGGRSVRILLGESEPPCAEAVPRETTLELAYAALMSSGMSDEEMPDGGLSDAGEALEATP